MDLKILGQSIVMLDELKDFKAPPAWRKATQNMMLVCAAIERALMPLKSEFDKSRADFALILETSSGEVGASAEFIRDWSQSRLARPVLFQNSLHNATTGFASIVFGITAPTLTISARSEEALRTAETLLRGGLCRFCIIATAEVHKKLAVLADKNDLQEGAAALIVTNTQGVLESKSKVLADLKNLETVREPVSEKLLNQDPLLSFEQDFIFQLIQKIEAGDRQLVVQRPNWGQSKIQWTT